MWPNGRDVRCIAPLSSQLRLSWGRRRGSTSRSEHKEHERAAAPNAMVESRLRHCVAFRTYQTQVAPNGMRPWIGEPPSRAEAAGYLPVAAKDIATRTNGETHQRLNANGHAWQKPPVMHPCNVLWEMWWTDGDRPAVVAFSCHSEGEGGTHYLWIQGPVWAQMRAGNLFASSG